MDFTFKDPSVRHAAKLVQALASDLRRLEQNIPLTVEQRIDAPLLDQWMITYRLEPALVGMVRGHPIRADGLVLTSGLFFLDRQQGFARTLSRYYRLGSPRQTSSTFGEGGR